MPNTEIIEKFLTCYQNHDYHGMQSYLDEKIHFSDYAFDIHGGKVKAMWHWFCIKYPPRDHPITVPEFDILEAKEDTVVAKYRVNYLSGEDKNPVDYYIKAYFTVRNDRITRHHDEFFSISEYEFAKMAFGFPKAWLALTPILRIIVKKTAKEKLEQFMHEHKND